MRHGLRSIKIYLSLEMKLCSFQTLEKRSFQMIPCAITVSYVMCVCAVNAKLLRKGFHSFKFVHFFQTFDVDLLTFPDSFDEAVSEAFLKSLGGGGGALL